MRKRKAKTEQELGEALNEDADYIEIEGDLGKKVIKIKATGNLAWVVCIATFAVAITVIITMVPAKGGISTLQHAVTNGVAATILRGGVATSALGVGVATSALSIAIAAGGVGALNKLRKYDMTEEGNKLILTKTS